MESRQSILSQLKQQGSRMTKTRKVVVELFQKNRLPITELEIRETLAKKGSKVNKTTIYRELEHLQSKDVIKEVNFGDGKKRFELNSRHHHHLICNNCKNVDEIEIEDDVSYIERKVSRQNQFLVTNHSLEFFGVCGSCAQK